MVDFNQDIPVANSVGVSMETYESEDQTLADEQWVQPSRKEKIQALLKQGHNFVQKQPYAVLVGAAGAGYILGRTVAGRFNAMQR